MKKRLARFTASWFLGAAAAVGLSVAHAESAKGNANANANKPTVSAPSAAKDNVPSSTPALEQPAAPASDRAAATTKPDADVTPATPAIPATPATPASPSDSATAAVPATPATPATPAVPADPSSLPTGRTAASVSAALDSATFAPTIRSTAIATRDQVISDVETRIAATETAMNAMGKTASEMSAEGHKQFKAASDDVKEKAKALRKSAQAARKATEQDWDAARAQLAADYEAYASALASIDASAGAAPSIR